MSTGAPYSRWVANRNRIKKGASAPTIWLWGLCIFLLGTPFYFLLTGTDPEVSVTRDAATGLRQEGANLPFYILRVVTLLLALFLGRAAINRVLKNILRCWPMVLFLAWALISLCWTEAFGTTLNGTFSLFSLVAVSITITSSLKPNEVVRAILCAGLILAVTSFGWSLLVPAQGVHQLADAGQSVHAGNWRGVFIHKNVLGQACAMFAVVALLVSSTPPVLRWTTFLSMITLVMLSGSGSAWAILLGAPLIAGSYVFFAPAILAGFATLGAVIATLVYAYLEDILSLFGKDVTLAGRTSLWELAFHYITENPVFGFAYMAPYGDFAFQAQRRANVFEPHNGYIDVAMGLGLVGLLIFVTVLINALLVGRRIYLASSEGKDALAFVGLTSAWMLSCLAESAARPTGATAALGFLSVGIMSYREMGNRRSDLNLQKRLGRIQEEGLELAVDQNRPL